MLEFDNRALRELPIDASSVNRTRQVFGACFSRVRPTPVKAPRTLAVWEGGPFNLAYAIDALYQRPTASRAAPEP